MSEAGFGAPDAIVIGAGPNGLAAAIVLARAGLGVTVLERAAQIGGGARTLELTRPGFVHDVCSAVHPLAAGSPFFRTLPLKEHGLEWIQPPLPLAHPLDDDTAVVLERNVDATALGLGEDATAYRALFRPLVAAWEGLDRDLLGPLHWPKLPLATARFARHALRSARAVAEGVFRGSRARALFAGVAAHSMLRLEQRPSAGFALVLMVAGHAVGWPIPRGGAQRIADALAGYLRSLGGRIVTNAEVRSLDELPAARAVLCDLTPRQLLRVVGKRLPEPYRRQLEGFRYGMAAYKVDWALDAPIPWRAEAGTRAGTLHLGGTMEEIAASERAAWQGGPAERPYVILAQPSRFDASRAPAGKHTAWAYCHVPNGSQADLLGRIEAQVERFAPGFRERILERSVLKPSDLERHNPNLVGGDIGGGAPDLRQLFFRPTRRLYVTPVKGLYLCSASTPPGPGVHGMCGYFAAQAALAGLG